MTLAAFLENLGIKGEDPSRTSSVTAQSFDWLRILFGLIVLYDAWSSLSFGHKTQMSQFMGLPMESPLLHVTVALNSLVEIALAVSLLAGRGIPIMGWVGVGYGLLIWLIAEHGGEFDKDATDPGIGLPYAVAFLYVIGADRLRSEPDVGRNQILSLARISFGLLWAYDAILKLQPYFIDNYLSYIPGAGTEAAGGMSTMMSSQMGGMMAAYDHAWVVASEALRPQTVAWSVAIVEVLLTAALLSGRGLRIMGPIGLGLSFVIWSVPEQFGGPYSLGVSGMPMALVGVAIIYMIALGYVWVLYNPLDLLPFMAKSRANAGGTDRAAPPHRTQPG